MVKTLANNLTRLFDLSYAFRFILKLLFWYLVFTFFHYAFIGITVPGGGVYVSFLDHYINYVVFIKNTVLDTAVFLGGLFNLDAFRTGQDVVSVNGAGGLFMGRPCYGLEIISFWGAFILSDTTSLRRKFYWGLGGIIFIWAINCLRVTLMLAALKYRWPLLYMDHHTLFNICAYALILTLIFIYYRQNKKQFGA